MAAAASYEEISSLVGDIDEPTLDRIREIGASASEIAEAVHRVRDGSQHGEQPLSSSSMRVAEVCAILEEHAESPVDDEPPLFEESVTSD